MILFLFGVLVGVAGCGSDSSRQAKINSHLNAAYARFTHLGIVRDTKLSEISPENPLLPLRKVEPTFKALHYRLAISIPPSSLKHPAFDAEVQITLRPNQDHLNQIVLDSAGLMINRVSLLNTIQELRFQTSSNDQLVIDLGNSYGPTDTLILSIVYSWTQAPISSEIPGGNDSTQGIYFPSRNGEVVSMYTLSQPDEMKFWMPGNTLPNDRASFEAIIQVPATYIAVSNGDLIEEYESKGIHTYHWSMKLPMVSYLYVITSGKFKVHRGFWKGIPLDYYSAPEDLDRTVEALRFTPDMLSFLSDYFGMPYPYTKYAQAIVPDFEALGMEHVTASTLTDRILHPENEPTPEKKN